MSILTKIVTTIFGSKSEKDLKEINPLVNEVNSIFATLENLSDDELKEKFSNHRKEIKSIRNDTMVRCQSEKLSSKETDDLIYNDEQKYLNDKMCEIFAIIKDAARRLVGTKYKVHLPEKYSNKPGTPVDAVIVDIPFKESFNANTREVVKG